MNDTRMQALIENEREWRKFLITQLESLNEKAQQQNRRLSHLEMWSLVFRLAGAAAVTFLWIWIEVNLTQ